MKWIGTDSIACLLAQGVRDNVFPGAVLIVAKAGRIIFHDAVGNVSIIPRSLPMQRDTIFDLASLTKPLATNLAIMKLVDDKTIDLNQPLQDLVPRAIPHDKRSITLRMLLCHSAGFTDWTPFYRELAQHGPEVRKGLLRDRVISTSLAYQPGQGSLYSDLGYMMLDWIIERVTTMESANYITMTWYRPLSLKRMLIGLGNSLGRFPKHAYAATEDCPWRKRIIQGEVHDENAFAVGGYGGHAGLFGTAMDVFVLMNVLRQHYRGERDDFLKPATVRESFRKQELVKKSSWALGWDTPSQEGSTAGTYFSPNSVGHLGFTGTSLWMDLDQDCIVVFLTNRIHPSRNNNKIRQFRPLLHDRIMMEGWNE